MAVSDQITRLGNEIATQEDLIEQISAVLDEKAAGGGGTNIETCTLTYATHKEAINAICCATRYIDGEIVSEKIEISASSLPYTIDNIIKNSVIYFDTLKESDSNLVYMIPSLNISYVVGKILGNSTVSTYTCFVEGTHIALSNGAIKNVEDIKYDDELLVWDFDNGCYSSAYPLWIKTPEVANYYYLCSFDNGIILKLVGSDGNCHRVFNIDDNRFEYANNCVGKRVMTQYGEAILLSCERVDETVRYYNIITNYHLNLFAESVLTSCRFNNVYPIKDMKFVKDNRVMQPYEAYNVPIEYYKGLRLDEQMAYDCAEVNSYVNNLIARQMINSGGVN